MATEQNNRRRALIITIGVHVALVVAFLFMGLHYMEPKPEDGIAIQFGLTDDGRGTLATAINPSEEIIPPANPENSQIEEETFATQDAVDAPAVVKPPKTKPKKETPTQEPSPPKPDSRLTGALSNVKGSENSGQGSGEQDGFAGSPTGTGNATGTGGGGGGGGNYSMDGRDARVKPKPIYDCPETGTVVVKVFVNPQGEVTRAIPGENVPNGPATTTTSTCLLERAKSAAMRTTWAPDPDAPELQVGYITYSFSKN
jgi:hypothetical protein